MNCQICLKKSDREYHAACLKQFFAHNGVDPVIPMTSSEFYERAPDYVTGFSISGAQVKMQIKVVNKQLLICSSGEIIYLNPHHKLSRKLQKMNTFACKWPELLN